MAAWVESRKRHILSKNPGMDESTAWALATDQFYATKKAPKSFGTAKGRRKAKKKYKKLPNVYEQKAKPKSKKKKKSFIEIAAPTLKKLASELKKQNSPLFERVDDVIYYILD